MFRNLWKKMTKVVGKAAFVFGVACAGLAALVGLLVGLIGFILLKGALVALCLLPVFFLVKWLFF